MNETNAITLRKIIEHEIAGEWHVWAERHPNMARVIDQYHLVHIVCNELSENEEVEQLLRDAAIDEATLMKVVKLSRFISEKIKQLIP